MKREEYEERMKDSKYRELTVTNCNSGKDYVFISYRGNSWKTVLTDIVYKLQKEYKLRIYFDKEFASETNIWIEQFIKNMDSSHWNMLVNGRISIISLRHIHGVHTFFFQSPNERQRQQAEAQ